MLTRNIFSDAADPASGRFRLRRQRRRLQTLKKALSLGVSALLISAVTVTGMAIFSPTASAEAVTLGTVDSRVSDHVGGTNASGTDAGTTNGYCIRYGPPTGSSNTGPSDWQPGGSEARTAHGRNSSTCPSNLDVNTQSAVGVQAVSGSLNPASGVAFNVGRITHYNNPISYDGSNNYFKGKLSFRLNGVSGAPTFDYDWWMWETPNYSDSCPAGLWLGNGNCQDQVKFLNQVADQNITVGGLDYKLVVLGFVQVPNGTACPADPGAASVINNWLTNERGQTQACLYAKLSQVRSLTVVKAVAGVDAPSQSFAFATTSNLAGSLWSAPNFTVTPPATPSVTRPVVSGETVTVTEQPVSPANPKWALTGLVCKDGANQDVSGVTYDVANRTISLSDIPEATSAAAKAITCTITNTYTGSAKLTLKKTVSGGSAAAAEWTLNAVGPATLTGSSPVSKASLPTGQYTLGESGGPAGYQQQGNWVCTNSGTGGNPSMSAGEKVTLVDGADVTCTVNNRFQTGTLKVVKQIHDPVSGYNGGNGKTFTVSYNCGAGFSAIGQSVSVDTPLVVTGIPTGRSCTVGETAPSGGLVNGSFAWETPTVTGPVTIADGQTATITVTNTVRQDTGGFTVSKAVKGPDGTAAGYTGGPSRPFTVNYVCTIGGERVASGSFVVSTGTPGGPSQAIPRTAFCSLTEEPLATQPGDFADGSYSWTDGTFVPSAITIGASSQSSVLTNTFTRDFGSLTIKKVVRGDGYVGSGEPFSVTYDCGAGDVAVALAAGGSTTITGLPANAICSLSEAAPDESLLDVAHDWGTPSWVGTSQSGQVTIAADSTKTVTVTNPTVEVFGTVSVVKVVSPVDGLAPGTTFAVIVDCGPAGSFPFTLTNGGPAGVTDSVPVGTRCTVSETAPSGGLVDASYGWGPTPAPQQVVVAASGQVVPVTVTNTIVRQYGTLSVIKTLSGPDVYTGGDFTGTWSCTDGSSGVWSIAAGGTEQVGSGILRGSTCTVTENQLTGQPNADDSSYVWGGVVYDPSGAQVVLSNAAPDGSVTVQNSITRLTGSFGITKTVKGDGATADPFTFSWKCTLPDKTTVSGELEVLPGGSTNGPSALPAGSLCTVQELGNPEPQPGHSWDALTLSTTAGGTQDGRSIKFTVPAPQNGAPVTVGVQATNTISPKFGHVTLVKKIGGAGGFVGGPDFAFTASVRCGTAIYPVTFTTEGSEPLELPLGSECTIDESTPSGGLKDASYNWTGPESYSPGKALTITEANQQLVVTITNPTERVYGSVTIDKTLTGPQGVVSPGRSFTGKWSCTYGDDTVAEGDWAVLAGDGPVQLSDHVLVTADCSATEDSLAVPSDDPSYVWDAPRITGGTVGVGEPAALTVANAFHRETGTIEVSKTVTGATAGYTGGSEKNFEVNADCSVAGVAGHLLLTASVADGGTTVLPQEIPLGWTCAISETTPTQGQLQDTSYGWGDVTVSPASATITQAGQKVAVAVKNPIERRTGTFDIAKVVRGPVGVDLSGVITNGPGYSGTWVCTHPGDPDQTGTWSVSSKLGGGATLTGDPAVLLNSDCSVDLEDSPDSGDLVNGSWAWGMPDYGQHVTVLTADDAPVVTVTNSVHRLWGALQLTKTTTDPDRGVKDGETVSGTWYCALGDDEWNGRWEVPATGGTVTLFTASDRIPATADCYTAENSLSDSSLKDVSFTWAAPSYGPNVTLIDGRTQTLTVANTVERVRTSVDIDKLITGGAPVAGTSEFGGTLSCTYGAEAPVLYPWTATRDSIATVGGILAGSVCVAVETAPATTPVPADPSYQWVPPVTYTGNPAIAPGTGGTVPTISVINDTVRITGSFGITKAVLGNPEGVDPGAEYGFDWSCDVPGTADPVTGVASIKDGETWLLPADQELPVGTECDVTERLPMPTPIDDAFSWTGLAYTVNNASEVSSSGRTVSFTIPISGNAPAAVQVVASNTLTRSFGAFDIVKSSDPVSGSVVQPGTDIAYRVTARSTGDVTVHDVVVSDDLSDVLADATLDEGSIVASAGSFVYDAGTKTLTWTVGSLAVAANATLDYAVRVKPTAWDVELVNAVTGSGDVPPEHCTVGAPCTTTHETPLEPATLTLVKKVDNTPFDGLDLNSNVPAKDDGGDWRLSATGDGGGFSGVGGSTGIEGVSVAPGSYTLEESLANVGSSFLKDFYKASAWSCDGAVLDGAVVAVAPGADVTCQITNTGETVDLRLTKADGGAIDGKPAVPTDVDSGYDYTFTVENVGTVAAPNVVVTDAIPSTIAVDEGNWVLPAGWTALLTGADGDGFGGTLTLTKTDGPLPPTGDTPVEFRISVHTATELPREGGDPQGKILDIVNTAAVTSGGVEKTPEDNSSTVRTPVKSIAVLASAMCRADAPWLGYSITPYNTENVDPLTIVLIWWTQAGYDGRNPSISASDSAAILADGAKQVDTITIPAGWTPGQTITGEILWPGAAVDANGNGIAWPGWRQLPTGQWVLDPSSPFSELREQSVTEFRMNPTTAGTTVYPPVGPNCNPGPTQPSMPTSSTPLAVTGFDGVQPFAVGILLLGLGAVILIAVRRRWGGKA
ncbi:DUF5979 domain-containing protein [Luethyella okanaganae]|uniref:DUF5979 domain-containing protein n=1 Tax=Luethyella okanaganae TaxID=69372 RepID=A0ABW1VDK5_9MICO